MIGLFDNDLEKFSTNNYLYLPNLEIMKLSGYYQGELEFCTLLRPDAKQLEDYEKIYYMSEGINNDFKIYQAFRGKNNVFFGGPGFTNGKYVPFKEEKIDKATPNINIYRKFLQSKNNTRMPTKCITDFLDCGYYRAFVNGNILTLPPTVPNKRFYIYDTDWFFNDWEYLIKRIERRSPSSIFFVHPIVCHNIEQYKAIRDLPIISRTNQIKFEFDTTLKELSKEVKNNALFLKSDIVLGSNVYLPVGGALPTPVKYYYDLLYKLNVLYIFWSQGIQLKIKYIPPHNGKRNPLECVENCIERWTISRKDKTFIECYKTKKGKVWKKIEVELNEAKKFYPEINGLFNFDFNSLKKRGFWNT